jgi:anthranilate synthase component 2
MIDNYDSFTYNLYALFRECGAEMKIIKNSEFVPADGYDGIILSPGPSSPENSGTTLRYVKEYIGKKAMFGVCLGMQSMAYSLGYPVVGAKTIKHGKVDTVSIIKESVLLKNIPNNFKVVRYHSLAVQVDDKLITSVSSDDGVVMSIEDPVKKMFGVQFHPESIMSEYGREIVNNFLSFI